MGELILPPAVPAGSAVAVVAPAGLAPSDELRRGLALLRERYDVRTFRELPGDPWGMMAGPDEVRAAELRWAFEEPEVRCVIAARGGYGTTRILEPPMFDRLRSSPRVVVGFSDLTALICGVLARAGMAAVHGPMVCQMGANGQEGAKALSALICDSSPPPPISGLSTIRPGRAEGRLVGGNLTMLSHLVGTGLMPSLDGAILFFEDVGERPYRIDRCLTHLRLAGLLDGVSGVVVGHLTACGAEKGERPIDDVILDHVGRLGVPACTGLSAGHEWPNLPLPLGVGAVLDATAGELEMMSPVESP